MTARCTLYNTLSLIFNSTGELNTQQQQNVPLTDSQIFIYFSFQTLSLIRFSSSILIQTECLLNAVFLALSPPSSKILGDYVFQDFYFNFCHHVTCSIWKSEISISQAKSAFPSILRTFSTISQIPGFKSEEISWLWNSTTGREIGRVSGLEDFFKLC